MFFKIYVDNVMLLCYIIGANKKQNIYEGEQIMKENILYVIKTVAKSYKMINKAIENKQVVKIGLHLMKI